MIDALASLPHYFDHLAPVWNALPPWERGLFGVTADLEGRADKAGITVVSASDVQGRTGPALVAGYRDIMGLPRRQLVLLEHGAGQTYPGDAPYHPGGRSRERVGLYLCPSERIAQLNRDAYPSARAVAVGCPKLDQYIGQPYGSAIAVAFHWRATVCREAGTAFYEFAEALARLARSRRLIGHGHPRAWRFLEAFYRSVGIEPVREFAEVAERAELLIVDNSSIGWEWAALDRPLVWLNSRYWRRDLVAWPRFWEHADAGVQCDDPGRLVEALKRAQTDPPEVQTRRLAAARAIYAYRDGSSAARAAVAIVDQGESDSG